MWKKGGDVRGTGLLTPSCPTWHHRNISVRACPARPAVVNASPSGIQKNISVMQCSLGNSNYLSSFNALFAEFNANLNIDQMLW